MLRRLPMPQKIVYCTYCKDVTPVATDRHGDYCEDCQRTIKPSTDKKYMSHTPIQDEYTKLSDRPQRYYLRHRDQIL
jgi:hypothetical protein